MKTLQALSKEQWTAVASAVLCALFLLSGGLGGSAAPAVMTVEGVDRVVGTPPAHFAEFVDDDFARYWKGRDIFPADTADRLPVPPLRAPEPRDEEISAFLFRPSPGFEVYNRLPLKGKYPFLVPGSPLVAEADAPAPAVIEELKKIEEPAVKPRADRRHEKERELFALTLKETGKKYEGRLVLETETHLRIVSGGQNLILEKSKLLKWEYNYTHEEQYRLDARNIRPGPNEAQERLKLGRRLYDLGMFPEAKAEIRRATELKKDFTEAYLLFGQICVEEGDFDGAVATYEAGLEGGADPRELHYETGRCLRFLGAHEGAVAAFERSLAASPRFHKAKLALARALLESGPVGAGGEVAADFLVKLGSAPDTTPAQRAEALLVRGLSRIREGDLDAAKADLDEVLKLDAQSAEATNAQAVVAALQDAPAKGGAGFVDAIKLNQYLTEAWTNLGALLLMAGRWADAETVYNAAAQRDPASVEAVAGAALAQILGGKKEAAAALEKAVALDPRHAPSRTVLGHLKLRDGVDDAALEHFVTALRGDAFYLPAYYGAATAYLRTAARLTAEAAAKKDDAGSEKEDLLRRAHEMRVNAETLFRTVRDFDRTRVNPWVALGCVYAVMGRAEEARPSLREADALLQQAQRPADPLIYYARGYVEYWYGGETDEARLEVALGEFNRGSKIPVDPKDALGARLVKDCEQAVAEIDKWKSTSIRLNEKFEAEGTEIPNTWVRSSPYGIRMTLDKSPGQGGRCKFEGKQALADMGLTRLDRVIPSDDFYALEATFYPEKTDKTEFGVSIYFSKQDKSRMGFHIGVDMLGKVKFNAYASDVTDMDRKDMSLGWLPVKPDLPDKKQVTFRIERAERNRVPYFDLYLLDPAKGEWVLAHKDVGIQATARSKENWTISLWARAWMGQEYLLYADNVRVYERARR
jgi:tetratricopeptide (TPR) repeat protein